MKENDEKYIKECQELMLYLLKYIHDLCFTHGIKYTLEAGTLIGAVRDKGFIAWDDDADISLVREEYDKLIEVLKKEKMPKDIGVYFPEDKDEFFDFNVRLYHKKVIREDKDSIELYDGIFSHPILDIYVMDHYPEDSFKRRMFVLKQQIIFGLAMSKRKKITIKKYGFIEKIAIFILSKIGKLFSIKSICAMHERASKEYLSSDVKFLYGTGWIPEYPGFFYEKGLYENVHLTSFEGIELLVLDEYDKVLTIGYGDWKVPKKTHDHVTIVTDL